jgi:glycosyltransferase involved in cell wall biosynthesis
VKYSVVLVTSGQLSANPRLVKEAVALDQAGYIVTVIYVPISIWADPFDELLFQKYSHINFIRAGYHPHHQPWLYKYARIRRKLLSGLYRILGDVFNLIDYCTVLFGQELLHITKMHKADLYIAHNLGALPVAIKVAQFYNSKSSFDAEDFHRGEFAVESWERGLTERIEEKYLLQVDYLSVASPLIGKAYKNLFSYHTPIVIQNVFSLSKLNKKKNDPVMRLFWFSQTVGKNRGIECVLQAMGLLKDVSVSFTILGILNSEMKTYLLKVAADASLSVEQLLFMDPVPEDELFRISSEFDIGLASEVPYCLNREYCLTNKIYTYLIAGNALALSDTKAQKEFLEEHPGIGMIYKYEDPKSMASVLRFYAENREILASHQNNARELAEKKLNWEMESKKLIAVVESVLQK